MNKIKNIFINLFKSNKIILSALIVLITLLLSSLIPTLAEFIYGDGSIKTSVWDGTVASSFKSGIGTENDPYLISNGSELAYLSYKLKDTNYINNYFKITNNIILNDGVLKYNNDESIEYILDDITYYIDPYTNKYYSNTEFEGTSLGTLNIFPSLNSFEGTLIGSNNTIYGLYLTDEVTEELALFTNLKGNVSDLYIKNALIYGGTITSGIASKTSNVTLENVYMDGYVIGKKNNIEKIIIKDLALDDINIYNYNTTNYIDLSNLLPFLGNTVNSATISGNYVVNNPNEASILINDTLISDGSFEIELGNILMDNVSIKSITTLSSDVITFSNIKYTVKYNYGISGGLIGEATNTTIKNSVNKSDVFGYYTSSGFVADVVNNLNIINSYNAGNINSNLISSGLIGTIVNNENNVIVTNSYNKGNLNSNFSGGLLGITNNSNNISFNNIFNTSNNNVINLIDNSNVNIINAYYTEDINPVEVGNITGNFVKVLKEDLEDKNFVITNLNYNEYLNNEDLIINSNNIWVYYDDNNPVLYYDSNISKTVNVYIGSEIYNEYQNNLNNKYFNNNITFTIDGINNFIPISKVEYYISQSDININKNDLELIDTWQLFTHVNQITDEGTYIIYFKITDYKDRITYINTDICILDLNTPLVSLSSADKTWDTFNNTLSNFFISKPKEFKITSSDNLSGIKNIYYYISDEVILENNLNEITWIIYNENIIIDNLGKYIIYVKVVDNSENIKYINTDFIIYNGFSINALSIGFDNSFDYGNIPINITNNSSLTLKSSFTYDYFEDINNYIHLIKSNVLLPKGTKLNLINHVTNKMYSYKITTDSDQFGYDNSCDELDLECEKTASYPFTLFSEIGQSENTTYLENIVVNDNLIIEDYTLILDFKDAEINNSYYYLNIYFELINNETNNKISTLENTYRKSNIYSSSEFNIDTKLNLNSNYSGTNIILNTESSTQIELNSQINYQELNESKIIDSTFENKKIGLLISLVDGNGYIINKKLYKNLTFKINNQILNPENDNLIRTEILNNENIILDIITTESKIELDNGTYYIKINNFISNDGKYIESLGENQILIPVIVVNDFNETKYGFNVNFTNTLPIIDKNFITNKLDLNITRFGQLNNPNIRISLYEKAMFTAYNQDYNLVDINDYIEENLELINNNVYYLTKNIDNNISLALNFKNNLNYNGYKIVFELFDGDARIDSIKKYIIVK